MGEEEEEAVRAANYFRLRFLTAGLQVKQQLHSGGCQDSQVGLIDEPAHGCWWTIKESTSAGHTAHCRLIAIPCLYR